MPNLDGLNEFADRSAPSAHAKPSFSRAWADAFLKELGQCGNVSKAASAVGIDRDTAYQYREQEPEFAAAWERAVKLGNEALEDEARRRAVDGWEEPVFFNGAPVGTVRKFSDRLLIVLLGATNPKKYRTNVAMQHSGDPEGEPVKIQITIPDNGRD